MDRIITKEEKLRMKRKAIIKVGIGGAIGIALITFLFSLFANSISLSRLQVSTVDIGALEVSVSASGKVIPAFEEIINSPINSRILEVAARGGDSVDVGTPLLKLDLQSVENDFNKMKDEEQRRTLQLEQVKINSRGQLSELEMNIKVQRMELNRREVELRNEKYLDSIGAGTADKIREVELALRVEQLKLNENEQKLINQRATTEADIKIRELELSIYRKEMNEAFRTLNDAQIRSPRKAILTYIATEVGAQIVQGQKVAVVSDLSHFKVNGEIADAYGDRVVVGAKAIVRIGNDELEGVVSEVTPLSKNGVISFTVRVNNDNHPRLRSGLKCDLFLITALKDDVRRIGLVAGYQGKGTYELFVVNGNEARKQKVLLGESNYQYVEVLEGLEPGDKVIISDMSDYRNNKKLKIK